MANFVEGIAKLNKKLERMDFSSNRQKNIIRRVARKGGNVLKDEVKSLIPNRGTFPYINHIKRSVKVRTSRSRMRPGVNVYTKGVDVPVSAGKGREWWTLGAYQHLVFFGNYKTKGRVDKRGRKHGNVRGITGYNPYALAKLNKGNKALLVMARNLKPEIMKEFKKIR